MGLKTNSMPEVINRLQLTKSEKTALDELIRELRKSWPDAKFKMFGSKAKGTADEESDLDLLILLPCPITKELRRQIIHKIFEINLTFETNISALIIAEDEWRDSPISLLPIHDFIEEEGVTL